MKGHPDARRTGDAVGPAAPSAAGGGAGGGGGRGVFLGTADGAWVWGGPERSTLILGPSRSGKTSSLVIPNILTADGAVVSTSTKPDVLRATAADRSSQGWTALYDPSGTVDVPAGVTRVGWSPVNASTAWDGALLTADAMVGAGRHSGAGNTTGIDTHWAERASSLLAPLLHAAALTGSPMTTVLSWVDRHHGEAALEVLADHQPTPTPADLLAGILATDHREQSGIWSTASGVLAAYRSSAALASTEGPFLNAESFIDGPNTLYICATGRRQQLLAPLTVGLLGEIRDSAYRRAARVGSGSHRPTPVLLALDEVANIAPIPDLPAMVAEGAGQGLLTLACLQDLSQARLRWGRDADAFLSLFGTTVVLGGIADIPTLRALSALAGDHEVATRTLGAACGPDGRFRQSSSIGTMFRPRLPVDAIGRGRPGFALTMDARTRMGWVRLMPAHELARGDLPSDPRRPGSLRRSGRRLPGLSGGPGRERGR